jgi:tetratricopeptide (TPR) repeat protein
MARLLVFPDRLSADYPRPAQTSTTRYRAMGEALVVTIWIVAAAALARRSPLTAFAMAWPVVMYLPLANLVPLTPFFVAERYLYVPSFGICLLVALGIERLRQRAAPLALGLAVLLVAAGAARSAIRVPEWHDALALWSSAARAFPDGSSKIHGELGFALLTAGRDAEAIPHLHRAIAIGPAEADTHSNLGLAFWRTGDRDAAIQEMTRAVAKMPENQMIRYNLALMLFQSGRLDEAEPHMRILASAEAWTDVHPSVRAALAKQGSSPAQLQADIRRWLTARDGAAHP